MNVQELKDLKSDFIREMNNIDCIMQDLDGIRNRLNNSVDDIEVYIKEAEKAEAEAKKPKIKPENCLHANRQVDDTAPNAEVIVCADCGLVLSFKHLG